ncbi:PREDICTED: uncharacterized protein LOC108357385, partial [Rhagoletis zephyria]|uniref:uncharacterized protein LOC108357385 n=1 Tax=Rhagoletis zephyria TaxID=28612 RepID=UPI00081179F8
MLLQKLKTQGGGVDSAEKTMNALVTRMSTFTYDPDHGLTFELWNWRYESVIENDGSSLDDAAKKHSELDFTTTVLTLKELFGHRGSQFARRYQYLQIKCEDSNNDTFDDYTGLVNERHEIAEISKITPEELKCLVWICGLKSERYQKVRQIALQFVEENPDATLKKLHERVKNFGRLQSTSRNIADTQGYKEVNL